MTSYNTLLSLVTNLIKNMKQQQKKLAIPYKLKYILKTKKNAITKLPIITV